MVLAFFYSGAGRRRKKQAEGEGGREREKGVLSLSTFFFVGIVILGSDFVPILGRRLGLVFSLLSSPPKAEEHRLGSGDSNLCLLALAPMRSKPTGLPPFPYYFIPFASLALACWLQQQQEFFGAYSLDA